MNEKAYRYAGLGRAGDVFRAGLAVPDVASRLARLCFVEERLMLMQSAFMVEAPSRDLTTLLSRLQNMDARHADFLRRRLRELRVPAGHFPDGGLSVSPDEALTVLVDEAMGAQTSAEMLTATLFLKRALCQSYESYLSVTNPIADSPGIEIVQSILTQENEAVALLQMAFDDLVRSDEEKTEAENFTSRLIEYSISAGGVDGTQTRGESKSRERSTQPRTIRHELARDESLSRVWDFLPPPQAETGAHLAHMMSIRLSEINVAEGLAIVLFETVGKPWDFYHSISRHQWDEVRHSLMGEAAIESTLGDRGALPMRDYEGVYCMEVAPLEQYAVLGLEVEGANMRYPIGKRGEWEFCKDQAKHPLMTTFQDFDWADEVLHVNIARAQLGQWFEGGARALSEFAKEGKANRTRVKKRHDAVTLPAIVLAN